jgi:DNA-directed RNA polymerase subunit RPC12/RpoP
MPSLYNKLELVRCPHCAVAKPNLTSHSAFETRSHTGGNQRQWAVYVCSTCGGVVTASARGVGQDVHEVFPQPESVDEAIPPTAHCYLTQALQSLHAPAGAVMLAASAVDSMLKSKNYKTGSLYSRIEQASKDHVITDDMAKWAHQVRLDANDQRHTDEVAPLPNIEDAKRCIAFAKALGEFIFVLPSRVLRGLAESKPNS